MNSEYLIFNILIFSTPFISVRLFPKTRLPALKPAVVSIGISALVFIAWDMMVTNWHWGFNPDYILGLFVYTLPLEEVLFFISVPFACLFLWITMFQSNNIVYPILPIILIVSAVALSIYFAFFSVWYTALVIAAFGLVVYLDELLKTRLFIKRSFYTFLGLVGLLTLVFNMYLTARPIVLYNELTKTNILIGTIPAEDVVYGWALVGIAVVLYTFATPTRSLSPNHTHPEEERK